MTIAFVCHRLDGPRSVRRRGDRAGLVLASRQFRSSGAALASAAPPRGRHSRRVAQLASSGFIAEIRETPAFRSGRGY
jgi:hypothetical protein